MADGSGTRLLDKQRMETNSWVDWLTRIGGRGGIRGTWPSRSFAGRKVKHGERDKKTVLRGWCCHWPCSTSVCTSSSEQESGTQMPSKYSTVPCGGAQPWGPAAFHSALFFFCVFTCFSDTLQYCPEKVGPCAEQHCCREPGWFSLPPFTLLPILPKASYTDTHTYTHTNIMNVSLLHWTPFFNLELVLWLKKNQKQTLTYWEQHIPPAFSG